MGPRHLSAALLLSLIASEASSAEMIFFNCPAETFFERMGRVQSIGLKATMQIEVPPGGADALRAAFQPYAASHGLLVRTYEGNRHTPPLGSSATWPNQNGSVTA